MKEGFDSPRDRQLFDYIYLKLKTLIIRTDKLGDFYQTIPYINCFKRLYGKKNVDIIVKKHIYSHIKKKKYLYNKIYSFPKNGILKKIFLILQLRKQKYKQVIIFDGKDRSIILSKFLNIKEIYHTYPISKKSFFFKLFFSRSHKTFFDNQSVTLKILYKKILDFLKIKIIKEDYRILQFKNIKKIIFFKNENIFRNKFLHIHIDEKWFSKMYIRKFLDISPNINKFYFFLKKIVNKKQTNIVITTGTIELKFIQNIIDKYFFYNKKGFFYFKVGKHKVYLLKKTSIEELETITMNAKNVITCHGPLSLISGSFNINLIDVINKSREKWYFRHTSHIRKYNKIYRENFNKLSKKIIQKIK